MADKMSIDKSTNISPASARHHQLQHQQHQHLAQGGHEEHHDSDDSLDSSPEDEHPHHANANAIPNAHSAAPDGQQPKRKGGRKPVSAQEPFLCPGLQCGFPNIETCIQVVLSCREVMSYPRASY